MSDGQESLVGKSLGPFQIRAELGRGNMGVVYRALQPALGREVAVKVLAPWLAGQPGFVERFRAEARAAAQLEHPGVVAVYDVGEIEGRSYIVMRLLVGRSLASVVLAEGPLPHARILQIGRQVAAALDHAHSRGVVHRDVKPQNVMVDAGDRVVLTDFGIARVANVGADLTQTGMVMGTPTYMAPELADGRPATAAVDCYALAVMLYELLAGQPPFRADTPLGVLMGHASRPPPPIAQPGSALPAALDGVFARALAKDPAARYPTCGAMVDAVAALLSAPAAATPTTLPQPRARRSAAPLLPFVAAGAVLLLLGGGLFAGARGEAQPLQPTTLAAQPATAESPAPPPTAAATPTTSALAIAPTIPPAPSSTVATAANAPSAPPSAPPITTSAAPPSWSTFAEGFAHPQGVAVDVGGNVYVSDTGNHRIVKLSSLGQRTSQWGRLGDGLGELNEPTGLAVDQLNNVYVADAKNHRVQVFASTGQAVARIGRPGTGPGLFQMPQDVTLDASGNVYVADDGNHRVQVFARTGTFIRSWGTRGSGRGQIERPNGVAVDERGAVYVADYGNHRIDKFGPSGEVIATFGRLGAAPGQFQHPAAVAVDALGNLYVADYGNDRLQKLSSIGEPLAQAGPRGSGPGQFIAPSAVAIDKKGNIYVADTGNNRIQRLGPPP